VKPLSIISKRRLKKKKLSAGKQQLQESITHVRNIRKQHKITNKHKAICSKNMMLLSSLFPSKIITPGILQTKGHE
jgi:hypothetical protein